MELNLPGTKAYHQVTIIRSICHWDRYKTAVEQNMQNDLRIYVQLVCNESQDSPVWESSWVGY